jgi:hypothetical protein
MPLQNRVTPFGEIVAVPARGTMMGNRGILHDAGGRLRRRWAGRLWICCLLEFRGRREPVMAPGHYTRLFFRDEPTALAAGHRPCAYCRRDAYTRFRTAWAAGNARLGLGPKPLAAEIDRVLHDERVGPDGSKRLYRVDLGDLPDGAFVTSEAAGQPSSDSIDVRATATLPAQLLWKGALWEWSPAAYGSRAPAQPGPVYLLTPPSIVAALANGYTPEPPAGLD